MPAPENTPTLPGGEVTITAEGCIFEEWNIYYLCRSICEGNIHKTPKFVNLTRSDYLRTSLGWFLILCTYSYFRYTVLTETDDTIYSREVKMGELLKFTTLWILMATVILSCDRLLWFYNMTNTSDGGGLQDPQIYVQRGAWKITAALRFTKKTIP